jgi:hypothetical protein
LVGSVWTIRTDCIPVNNLAQIVENLISLPPQFQINGDLCKEFLLIGASIIDQLWKYRNSRVHEGSTLCAKKILRNVSVLVFEHRGWRLIQVDLPHTKIISPWLPLPRTLKFNCDATVGLSYSSIAVVARD